MRISGIKKLNHTNYPTWAIQMKLILDEMGLLGLIEGTEPGPEDGDTASVNAYNEKVKRTMRTIVLAVEDDILLNVMSITDPREIWAELELTLKPKSRLLRLVCYQQLVTAQMHQGEDMQDYVNRIRQLAVDAVNAGCEPPSEEFICHIMINGLPEPYASAVMVTETFNEAEYTIQRIETLLVGEFQRQASLKKAESKKIPPAGEGSALSMPCSKAGQRKELRKCFNCNLQGHLAKDCKKPKRKQNHKT